MSGRGRVVFLQVVGVGRLFASDRGMVVLLASGRGMVVLCKWEG